MTLEQIFQSVEQRLYHWGQALWPEASATRYREQAESLTEAIRESRAAVNEREEAVATLRGAVADREIQAALLASSVESSVYAGDLGHAWRQALELDCLRQTLADDRGQLERLWQILTGQQSRLHRQENQLAILHEKLYAIR
jgi:hypothetical protein